MGWSLELAVAFLICQLEILLGLQSASQISDVKLWETSGVHDYALCVGVPALLVVEEQVIHRAVSLLRLSPYTTQDKTARPFKSTGHAKTGHDRTRHDSA